MLRNVLLVGAGGMLGAVTRYGAVQLSEQGFQGQAAIFAILLVNVLGSFMLGLLVGTGVRAEWSLLLGVGFCGGLTTFSTWMLDLVVLHQKYGWYSAASWLVVSVVLGVTAVLAGLHIGKRV